MDIFPLLDLSEALALSVILLGTLLLIFKPYRNRILVMMFFVLLGILGYGIATDYAQNELYPVENKYVSLKGYVSDLPDCYGDLYTYKLKLTEAEYMGNIYTTSQTVRISSYEKLEFGDTVSVKGFLKRFSDKNNSTDFNTRRYYQSRGIFYKLYARELADADISVNKLSFNYMATAIRNEICNIIDGEFSGDDSAVLKAVSTGNKRLFSTEYKSLLMKTGIIKYFYSAFFHTHFIMFLISLLFVRCRKSIRDIVLATSMLVYAAFNSGAPVFVRSAFTVILALIALKRFGFSHKPDLMAVTVLAVSLANPLYCFDTGFIMSVSCSMMFCYFYDLIIAKLYFLPFGRKFTAFYIITTIMMLPVTAYLFNGVSPYTNLLGPIFSAAVGLILLILPLMGIFSGFFGSAMFLKPIMTVLILPFVKLPYWIEALPCSHFTLKTPAPTPMAAAFTGYYLLYQVWHGNMKHRKNILAAVCCLGLWCSIPISYFQNLGTMSITFVNVGQGDGAVVSITGGETLLIDGGGKYEFSDYDAGENIFLPYLIDNGYNKIDKAIVSHFHSDHVLGIISAVKNLEVGEIIMPDIDKDNEYRKELERLAGEKDIPIRLVQTGDIITLNSGASLNVISSASSETDDSNEGSIVMKLEYNEFSCLFTGDIGRETENKIKDKIGDCDVVKMAHHGSANSNSAEFASAITAEYAIASAGENNIYGFPKDEAVYNYQQSGAKVIRTDINGDITIAVQQNGGYSVFKNSN